MKTHAWSLSFYVLIALIYFFFSWKWILYQLLGSSQYRCTLMNIIINMDSSCGSKCGFWSAGFIRSQLIWVYTVFQKWYKNLKKKWTKYINKDQYGMCVCVYVFSMWVYDNCILVFYFGMPVYDFGMWVWLVCECNTLVCECMTLVCECMTSVCECITRLWVYDIVMFCCFTSQVNSYGHGGTVSSPNHTFSWTSLNKQLTSTSCTYFCLCLTTTLLEWFNEREEKDCRNYFMINYHESKRPDWDRTPNPWICSQTHICCLTGYQLRYAVRRHWYVSAWPVWECMTSVYECMTSVWLYDFNI